MVPSSYRRVNVFMLFSVLGILTKIENWVTFKKIEHVTSHKSQDNRIIYFNKIVEHIIYLVGGFNPSEKY